MPLLFDVTCIVCGVRIRTDNPYRLYCSNAHRQAAYRAKARTPRKAPVHAVRNRTQRTTRQVLDRQHAATDRRRYNAIRAKGMARIVKARTKAKPPKDPGTKRKPNKRRRRIAGAAAGGTGLT